MVICFEVDTLKMEISYWGKLDIATLKRFRIQGENRTCITGGEVWVKIRPHINYDVFDGDDVDVYLKQCICLHSYESRFVFFSTHWQCALNSLF